MFGKTTIKWETSENKKEKLPSKMSKRKIINLLMNGKSINSGLLKNIILEDNKIIFLIKDGEKLKTGSFPLAKNKYQWLAIKSFLQKNKVSANVQDAIKDIGIIKTNEKSLIKIEE